MEGFGCSVRSLAALERPRGPATLLWAGSRLLLGNGSNLLLLCAVGRPVKAVHTFPAPVVHLTQSPNEQGLYALCQHDGIHFLPFPQLFGTSSCPSFEDSGSGGGAPASKVIADPDVHTFAVADGILVTVGLKDGTWNFTFYEIPEPPVARHRKLAERHIFTTTMAGGTVGLGSGWGCERPVLCCVYARCSVTSKPPEGNDFHILDSALFSLLFGVDASLISSPVFVCGLPDGRLCSLPALQQPNDMGPTVKVLHSLEEPVVFLGTFVADHGSGALVVVGRFGKVLMVLAEQKEGGRVLVFRERSLAGPVVTANLGGTRLYYSTLSDLLALPLGTTEQQPATSSDPPPSSHNPVSLNVCSVIALAKPITASTGAVEITAMSDRGRLLKIALLRGPEGCRRPRLSAAQAGQKVKDLLSGIGNIADRASSFKSRIQERNLALKKLNNVFNICCLLLPTQNGNEGRLASKPPISICLTTKWVDLLQQESLTLSCILENSSSYVLECGWTLCVQVAPSYSSMTSENTSTKTYCFPIEELAPGKTLDVTLPLAPRNELLLPVKVCSSLVYSLQSLLGSIKLKHVVHRGTPLLDLVSDSGLVSLDLNALTVDLLDCLRIEAPGTKTNNHSPDLSSSADFIQAFLQARRWTHSTSGPNIGPLGGGPFRASLRVSPELLKNTLAGSTFGSPSLCDSLLAWLVSGCPGRQSRGDLSCPVVCARCPQGDTLRLMAKEVCVSSLCSPMTVGELGSDGPVQVVEVQLESSSVATLCGLHHAVLWRIQTLAREAAKETGGQQLQGQNLQSALERAEALLQEIRGARGQAALGTEMVPRTAESLLRVYGQLRDQSLLIL